jgi:hypothetical protein
LNHVNGLVAVAVAVNEDVGVDDYDHALRLPPLDP